MDNRTIPDINISEYCEKHETKKIVSWCPIHTIGVCEDCSKNGHSDCDGIQFINGNINQSEINDGFKQITKRFFNIRKVYKKLKNERKSNTESLNIQKTNIKEQIRSLRETVFNTITELENRLLKELEQAYGEYTTSLNKEITDYRYRNAVIKSTEEESKKARKYGTDLQITLAEKHGILMADKEEENLRNLKIKNFSVELKLSDHFKQLMNLTTLGSIEKVEADSYVDTEPLTHQSVLPSIPLQNSKTLAFRLDEHRWHRTRLKSQREFNLNTSLNKFLPEITGSVFLPDDTIILADAAHNRLLHVNDKGNVSGDIPMKLKPFDVGVVGKKMYVSFVNQRNIDAFDVKTMKQIDQLILPSNVSGINGYKDSLLVAVCEKTGLYLLGSDNSINIISLRQNEDGPIDVSADTICYAETKKCLVHAFTHLGNKKFTIKIDGIGYIHGVALLKDCSILAAKFSPGRHSVFHISKDGREKMLRLELNDISAPRSLAVNRKKRKILLVHGVRKISIFQEL